MGVVLMSQRGLNRIDVLARLDGRRLTASAAADLMRVTVRQTLRLLKRYRDGGAPAIALERRPARGVFNNDDAVRTAPGPLLASKLYSYFNNIRVRSFIGAPFREKTAHAKPAGSWLEA